MESCLVIRSQQLPLRLGGKINLWWYMLTHRVVMRLFRNRRSRRESEAPPKGVIAFVAEVAQRSTIVGSLPTS
jgi:hypothetical protein